MGILEYGAKFCAKKLDEMDRTQRYPIAVPSPEIVLHTDKTTPRLIQFHTLKNAVNPPFLGGFLFSGTVAA